jgi:beta-N-acetylhexosaminidase
VVTFLLGLGIGWTLCYAFLDVRRDDLPDPGFTATEGPPANIPPAPPPVPEDVQVADVDGLWPAEHLFVGVAGRRLDGETEAWLGTYRPGGVILRPSNLDGAAQAKRLITSLKEAVGLGTGLADGPFVLTSQDGGPLNPLKATDAPPPADLGVEGGPARARKTAARYAAMARAQGFSGFLSPALDVYSPGVSQTSVGVLSFGTDLDAVWSLGSAFVEGISQEGLIAVVKHFPGLGGAQVTPQGGLAITSQDLSFVASHMYPFRSAVQAKVPGILVAPIAVPEMEDGKAARPAVYSPKLLTGVVREQWGYDGVVLADDLLDSASDTGVPIGDRVVQSLAAGADAVMLLNADAEILLEVCRAIHTARDEGVLSADRLDVSKDRLRKWREILAAAEVREAAQAKPVPSAQPPNTELLRHTVQNRETLGSIAQKYNVKLGDLKSWNGLNGDDIQSGQKLTLYLPKQAAPEPEPEPAPEPDPAPEATPEPAETVEAAPEEPAAMEEITEGEETPEGETAEGEAPEVAPEEEAAAAQPPNTVRKEVTVTRGDTLTDLAERNGVTMADVIAWNDLDSPQLLANQKLVLYLPEGAEPQEEASAPSEEDLAYYTVKPGETLHRIAVNHGTTAPALAKMNDLPRPDHVFVGQRLRVPRIAGEDPIAEPAEETEVPEETTEGEPVPEMEGESEGEPETPAEGEQEGEEDAA